MFASARQARQADAEASASGTGRDDNDEGTQSGGGQAEPRKKSGGRQALPRFNGTIWFQPSWIVRTTGPIQGITTTVERALKESDSNLPVSGFFSMNQILSKQLQMQRIEVLLLSTLAGLALLLSAIGIYALVSNLVVQRTREIGIRLALGSTIRQAILQVGSSGTAAAVFGLIFGIVLSLAALRVLASEIYGVKTYDPVTLIVAPLLLGFVSIAAGFLPTLRISRIDPADTLRSE